MDDEKTKDEELGENLEDIFEEEYFNESGSEVTSSRRLQKIKKNSLIAGVCAGIAYYFGIEPLIVRVIFIISIFFGGWGIVAYFLAAMLLPSEIMNEEYEKNNIPENNYGKTITGSLFVFVGLYFIANNFGFEPNIFFFGVSNLFIVPFILLGSGIFLIVKFKDLRPIKSGIRNKNFIRSNKDKRILGVCGGLADYLNVESNNLRMIWIVFTFITIGIGLILYIFLAAFTKIDSDIKFEI